MPKRVRNRHGQSPYQKFEVSDMMLKNWTARAVCPLLSSPHSLLLQGFRHDRSSSSVWVCHPRCSRRPVA
ncbi:hypothetical protein BN873_790004 [Candidatus Competibacter denitrificans Run_A_D11]|uniref:Uncharacterized protein n=1 Tax=Candidatus Competibacter denitrificans Run_A_D11 TaxID=1400863 RepID=W6ME55_9GAMM|nr:hypothetical protein BN873_790004 [Candidatus Competibacter denitrificans Run_A_D11]